MEKEQIIKALECCTRGRKSKEDIPCLECHYNECNLVGGTGERQISGTCQGWLMKDALSLIREQENRIEELTLEYAGFEAGAKAVARLIQAATVRKMVERLKEKAIDVDTDDAALWMECVTIEDVNQIEKELLEDKS